jgi:ABC-type arginine transport system permease subunit
MARNGAARIITPYLRGAVDAVPDAVILACQDHGAAARRVWLSFALSAMAQAAWPPVSLLSSDR